MDDPIDGGGRAVTRTTDRPSRALTRYYVRQSLKTVSPFARVKIARGLLIFEKVRR